ncbi:3-hydroxyacyl-CoA dehydrogenase NAD-binding domain-containing protein [Rhodococcus sp. IEGM 1366]|uniref:3-hydroxyacyl-CoA dehydrogenase NAD-binding domain-containing protein n=1 Tax=Rhodococcus sp. IEGM 1366 TaxID=3082223 RepID=UPI0029540766|nr:3-hydroxyacyl-CoA dehydrogenase NAD-binding domain-containing protein [Rhodococcus sp. IEGM 1366]MDV8070580.1 3-hydroxyacyl-CoA dehydrogenase NAD-binding domain-containing protein [Rhodococcus sp. IEGM 1366]
MTICTSLLDGDVVVVTIDNPPVNAGSHAVRSGLLAELAKARDIDGLRGVVITGSGANFYSGSDIREFDGPLAEPQLPAVIREIESLPVPVVAAISGLALGGGFELALGCDLRIADRTAVVGLPEVGLGIIPGAGGTVRLPRLVGATSALELIGTAARIKADQAHELGILDALVDDNLVEHAIAAARAGSKRILRELSVPEPDRDALAAMSAHVTKKGKSRPHILEAIDAVHRATTEPGDVALTAEREVFTRLRESEEAASLRYLFFAERAAAKALRSTAQARPVNRVTVVGAGTMGASIAAALVLAGFRTTVTDTNIDALERTVQTVAAATAKAGRTEQEPSLFTTTTLIEALINADLVIDAVFEDLDVKRTLFRALDEHAPAAAILASNTSYLDLDDIGSVVADPSRVVGLHFFNPAHLNRLVEVVETAKTSPEVIAALSTVVRRLGKTGIRARVGEGFVANRIYAAYRAQCEFLVEDGCSPEQIDRALTDFGFAMGPFAVADMSGLDIAWSRRKRLAPNRDPQQRYVRIPDLLCEEGRLGRKTGAGWYKYPDGSSKGLPDPKVEALIDAERTRKAITAKQFDDETIVRRVIASMVSETVGVLSDGVAARATDIDLALVNGFAFPRQHGGPLRYASHRQPDWLATGLQEVYESCPVTYRAAHSPTAGAQPAHVIKILDSL